MTLKFDPNIMRFTLEADELAFANSEVDSWASRQEWRLMGENIGNIVRLRLPYVSWVPRMYQNGSLGEAPMAPTVTVADYVATSQTGSASQTTRYVRPTFTHVLPTEKWVLGGGWYHMDDTRYTGWNAAQEVSVQITEEMEQDVDSWLSAILVAAIPVSQQTTASEIDFDTFRDVIADASSAGFPVSNVIMSRSRAMDMANWGTSNVTWLWAPLSPGYGAQIAAQGYVSNFMGVQLQIAESIPDDKVYFYGDPGAMGRRLDRVGGLRRLMAEDIDNRTVRFSMDQLYMQTTASAADVWQVTIT